MKRKLGPGPMVQQGWNPGGFHLPSALGRASTLPLQGPYGQRITSPQILETVPGGKQPFGGRLKAGKWVSGLLEESFREHFRRQECTPFPFLGCSVQSWPGRTEGNFSLSCGFMGIDCGCCPVGYAGCDGCPWTWLTEVPSVWILTLHRVLTPGGWRKGEKIKTSGNGLRSGHCSRV